MERVYPLSVAQLANCISDEDWMLALYYWIYDR